MVYFVQGALPVCPTCPLKMPVFRQMPAISMSASTGSSGSSIFSYSSHILRRQAAWAHSASQSWMVASTSAPQYAVTASISACPIEICLRPEPISAEMSVIVQFSTLSAWLLRPSCVAVRIQATRRRSSYRESVHPPLAYADGRRQDHTCRYGLLWAESARAKKGCTASRTMLPGQLLPLCHGR